MWLAAFAMNVKAQLPNFTKTDNHGVTHELYQDLREGKAVLLAFGAGWCAPCIYSDQFVEKFFKKFGSGSCSVKTYIMLFETNIPYQTTTSEYGVQYAQRFNLTTPIITDIGDWGPPGEGTLTYQYFEKYQTQLDFGDGLLSNYVPFFLIIIPDKDHPEKSVVKEIAYTNINFDTDLEPLFSATVADAGYYPPPPITVTGNLCSDLPFSATLTSGFASDWQWSTGATAKSIVVNESGVYTVTNNGCSVSKNIEFNSLPLVGNASISTNTICRDGIFSLNYETVEEQGSILTWMFRKPSEDWVELSPVTEPPLIFLADADPGTEWMFAVRAQNGSNNDPSCIVYSNLLHLTITNDEPTVIANTITSSTTQICTGSQYYLNYSGGLPLSYWQYYDEAINEWVYWQAADANPLTFIANQPSATVQGLPGDKFRVKSQLGSCYAVSNVVEVSYLNRPSPAISGPELFCEGSGKVVLQVNSYSGVVWSTGSNNTSISVAPSSSTWYSVTVTDVNGCSNTTSHFLYVVPRVTPIITSNNLGSICPGGSTDLSFGGFNSSNPCTNAPLGQWPEQVFTPVCGDEINLISDQAYLGEYSVVNVIVGQYYYFYTLSEDYQPGGFITTITNSDGSETFASGKDFVLWRATFSGTIRMYSATSACGSNDLSFFVRAIYCTTNLSSLGTLLWSNGSKASSITVAPSNTTTYSLTFTDANFRCSSTANIKVPVGDDAIQRSTTQITSTAARLNWVSAYNPDQWQLRYKGIAPGDKWVDVSVATAATRFVNVSGLKANQNYNWQIRAKCGKAWTEYTGVMGFKTLANAGSGASSRISNDIELPGIMSFMIKASPNPSRNAFNIMVNSEDFGGLVTIQVFDQLGRMVDVKRVNPNTIIQIGNTYSTGTYYLKAIQGDKHSETTIVKVSN